MSYIPRSGSLAALVCAWLKQRPGATIDEERVCALFQVTKANAAAQLGAAEDAGYLESTLSGRFNVYRAGPALAKWTPAVADASKAQSIGIDVADPTPKAPPAKPAATRQPRLLCKPMDLVIEDNVPLRKPSGGEGAVSLFDGVFAAMKVGQSFSRPHSEAKALKDSADRWGQAQQHRQGQAQVRSSR